MRTENLHSRTVVSEAKTKIVLRLRVDTRVMLKYGAFCNEKKKQTHGCRINIENGIKQRNRVQAISSSARKNDDIAKTEENKTFFSAKTTRTCIYNNENAIFKLDASNLQPLKAQSLRAR